jgi:hypothetical protein
MSHNPLAEFWKFVEDAGSLEKAYLGLPVGLPVLPSLVHLIVGSPLWTESSNLVTFFLTLESYVTLAIIYLYAFQVLHPKAKSTLTVYFRRLRISSFVLLIIFIVFFYFFTNPLSGLGYSREARQHLERHPDITVMDLIEEFGNNVDRVFSGTYLTLMRLGLLLSWLLFYTSTSCLISVFVILQRKKQSN